MLNDVQEKWLGTKVKKSVVPPMYALACYTDRPTFCALSSWPNYVCLPLQTMIHFMALLHSMAQQ